MRRIFFDHLASTPVLPEVFEAMRPHFLESFGNPSSLHQWGLNARDSLARARAQVADLIHAASPEDILFTSGGTESANLAVKGTAYAQHARGRHLVVSAAEHAAVLKSAEFLESQGFTCTRVPVDREGRVDPDGVRAALTDQTILIAVHHANHELGTIQPIAAIGRIAAERGIPLFVDATASGGWLPIDVDAMNIRLLSLSPHRFYGPKGVGILYRHRRARLVAIQHGGAQEEGRRAGTENVPAIVGAGVAAALARRDLDARSAHLGSLQRRLWEGLGRSVTHLQFNGPAPGPDRHPGILNFSTEFIEGESLALRCDLHGIAVASGSSCLGRSPRGSHVLAAIGLDPALARSHLILSLGHENTAEDVDHFLEVFPSKVVAALRAQSPLWDDFQRGLVESALRPRAG